MSFTVPPRGPSARRAAGRSVQDYATTEELRQALETTCSCTVDYYSNSTTARTTTSSSDWLLSVPDPEAVEQTVEDELARLLTLKSYLLLDSEQEEAFDELTRQACQTYNVPTSLVSLVDLGRQFWFGTTNNNNNINKNNNNKSTTAQQQQQQEEQQVRETCRQVAFCAHTILNKYGICVVNDTKQDDRFKNNPLVNEPPFLRFYAGAPLISPEGYKLGTFCVEGPEPRPNGLTLAEQEKLKEYAAKAMTLMVERRKILQERLSVEDKARSYNLQRHAGIATNLGGILYSLGETVTAMRLFQESVQTHMYLEEDEGSGGLPPKERQVEIERLLASLSAQSTPVESRQAFVQKVIALYPSFAALPPMAANPAVVATTITGVKEAMNTTTEEKTTAAAPTIATAAVTVTGTDDSSSTSTGSSGGIHVPLTPPHIVIDGIPGLFNTSSKLKGLANRQPTSDLIFCEAFKINMEENSPSTSSASCSSHHHNQQQHQQQQCPDDRQFIIPLAECSKATLFNMALIHYRWGSPDLALQFFDLAASLSKRTHPLAFDPVVLACLNNMAQIHLQFRRPKDAMELLSDALARGNAALSRMCSPQADDDCIKILTTTTTTSTTTTTTSSSMTDNTSTTATATATTTAVTAPWADVDLGKTKRLRRKLARTVMNIGHVHFFTCDYDAAMSACRDALSLLLKPDEEEEEVAEVAAAWYNISLLHYFKGNKLQAIEFLDKYLDFACKVSNLNSPHHIQIGEALYRKGQIMYEMGNLYDCMKPLNHAWRIRRLNFGESHALVAESLSLIGKVLQAREEYDFALNALQKSLDIQRLLSQDEDLSFEVAQTLLEVGRAYHAKGHLQESLQVYQEASVLTRQLFGERHAFVARIDGILGNLHLENGSIDASLHAFREAMHIQIELGLPIEMNVVRDRMLVWVNDVDRSRDFAPCA